MASSISNANINIQLELFWAAGTLAPGSMRISWLGMVPAAASAGLSLTYKPTVPAQYISQLVRHVHSVVCSQVIMLTISLNIKHAHALPSVKRRACE